MNVVSLVAYIVRIPLRKKIRHASHTRTDTDNIIVRCQLADGTVGYGEGVPREYVTGESAGSALALLKKTDFRSQWESCPDFATVLKLAERLQLPPVPGDERNCAGNAARCALELALLDAYGRAYGEPLCNITQLLAPEIYQFREKVQYSGAITSSRGLKLAVAAWGMRFYGFRQLKVKVGIEGYDDVSRLKKIRRRVGSKVELRIDANEAWAPNEAVAKIQALEPFGISVVEQPIPHAAISELPAIRKQVRTPIMLDESLCSMVDAENAIRQQSCDRFNLRLSKCGGFIPTLRLAQKAREHGLSYQLGCQVGESVILTAAGRQFATSVCDLTACEGSFDRHLLNWAFSDEDLTFKRGGWAPALVRTGLGVAIQPEAVARLVMEEEVLLE